MMMIALRKKTTKLQKRKGCRQCVLSSEGWRVRRDGCRYPTICVATLMMESFPTPGSSQHSLLAQHAAGTHWSSGVLAVADDDTQMWPLDSKSHLLGHSSQTQFSLLTSHTHTRSHEVVPPVFSLKQQRFSFCKEGNAEGWILIEWQKIVLVPISKSAQFENLGRPRS